MPLRLRHQIRLAAGFLFAPWLLTVFLCWPEVPRQPSIILGLLPGLAVAVYLQLQLSRHLGTNHRCGEDDHPFTTLGAANWITLLRGSAIVGLAGFLTLTMQSGPAWPKALRWVPGIIYLGISLADLMDGFVARKQGQETELGKRLDIESDAAGLLVASLVAVALDRLPAVYLLVGMAYYVYILGIWLRLKRSLPVIELQPRPYARIIAGFQMGLVGVALLPIFNPPFIHLAALIFMMPLLIGFLRDWRMVSCRVKTSTDRQSALVHQAETLMIKTLPLMLRLVLIATGITTLAGYDVGHNHLPWQLALTACCMLAGMGCLGRCASLVLTLMLASSTSPFGISLVSIVIFGAAATLMLTGTGAMSLWAPEEMILYRRRKTDGTPQTGAKTSRVGNLFSSCVPKPATVRRGIQNSWRWLLGVLGLALAWHALRGVEWDAVWDLLAGLSPLAILGIAIINLLMLPLMTARWWLLLRTLGWPVSLLIACAYRAAANAVSYLTPGPHFGGEPLSVYCLQFRHGIPLSVAATAVAVDRLLELLATFLVLAFCLISLALAGSGPFNWQRDLIVVIALLAVFAFILGALFTGKRPVTRSVSLFKRFDCEYFPSISRCTGSVVAVIAQGEAMAESLFREHRRQFLLANFLSLMHWLGVFAEFWLMSAFLGLPLSFWQLTAVVVVARLSFFTPLPAGIGVLESALPWVTAVLGLGGALGLSLCLIIRCRDLIFSLTGLGLGMHYLTCRRKASIINDKEGYQEKDPHGR